MDMKTNTKTNMNSPSSEPRTHQKRLLLGVAGWLAGWRREAGAGDGREREAGEMCVYRETEMMDRCEDREMKIEPIEHEASHLISSRLVSGFLSFRRSTVGIGFNSEDFGP